MNMNEETVRHLVVSYFTDEYEVDKAEANILYECGRNKIEKFVNEEFIGMLETNENMRRAGMRVAMRILEIYE